MNPTKQPLVSVLMTCYNREKYIAEAIESVLASSYANFELIIVDDCSVDRSVNIANQYKEKDSRISVYVNEKNLKDYGNRNKAATYARGKYIKYVDSDDVIYPWGLEAMVYCMEECAEAGYGLISYGLKTSKKFPVLLAPANAYYEFFFRASMIITGPTGAIFRRDVFEKEGGFTGKPYLGDTEMWLKLSMKNSLVAMPLDLVWWRQHEGQQYREGVINNYYETNRYQVYLDALQHEDCPLPEKYKVVAIRNLKSINARRLITYLAKGNVRKSFALFKTFNLTPSDTFKSFRFNKYPPPLS